MRFRGVCRLLCVAAFVVLALTSSDAAQTTVKDDHIEEVPGLWFENIVYYWDNIVLDIVNSSRDNIMFGGSMIFLDSRGRQVAKASLLPKKIPSLETERYIARMVEGSGETARRAARVIWDFGAE